MNLSKTLTRKIKAGIPIGILNLALKDFKRYRASVNIDTLIENNILNDMYDDMNLLGGVSFNIPISDFNITFSSEDEAVLELKDDVYPNRKITTVTEIIAGHISPTTNAIGRPVDMLARSVGPRIYGSFDTGVELLSDREIYISTDIRAMVHGTIVCYLSYGSTMSEIGPKYHLAFAKLAVMKAKAWIYNKLIIKISEGKIHHGHSLPVISDIVRGYENFVEDYENEMDIKGYKYLFMNDKSTMKDSVEGLFSVI